MYNSFQLARNYFRFYLRASNGKGHGMHSPFVFQFILHVLNNQSGYIPPEKIELLRKELLEDQRIIEVQDLGAGSRTASSGKRKVRQIARSALKSKRLAQLLFRLVKFYQPNTIVELGTSLGLTTAYLSAAAPASKVITMEGSREIALLARENFSKLGCANVELVEGNFDELLPALISGLPSLDLAYVDGNHRYQPTIRYFHELLARSHKHSILVFDDIHWSAEMERAWEEIKAHPAVKYTIDIFFLGFVFFREEFKVRQDFLIRY